MIGYYWLSIKWDKRFSLPLDLCMIDTMLIPLPKLIFSSFQFFIFIFFFRSNNNWSSLRKKKRKNVLLNNDDLKSKIGKEHQK